MRIKKNAYQGGFQKSAARNKKTKSFPKKKVVGLSESRLKDIKYYILSSQLVNILWVNQTRPEKASILRN